MYTITISSVFRVIVFYIAQTHTAIIFGITFALLQLILGYRCYSEFYYNFSNTVIINEIINNNRKARGCDQLVNLTIVLLLKYCFGIHNIQGRTI